MNLCPISLNEPIRYFNEGNDDDKGGKAVVALRTIIYIIAIDSSTTSITLAKEN